MKKTKRLLSVAFGIIFALSSYNSEHGYNSYSSNESYEHAHELEHHEEHDHDHENESLDNDDDDINLGNSKLGISILSKSKTKADESGVKFGVHTMDTSSSDDGYGSIELQANYSPDGCLKDSVWSVSDTSALKVTPNAIDSSICVVEALKEFDGEVTISVKSKFFSDICATLKATYVGGFNIEVISGTISLNATRKCAHSSTTITESPNSKSNLSNYFKIKYKGSYLSESQLYNYINNGDLIVSCTGDLTFNNNSNAPYFLMKDLTASSSAGSKVIGASIKVKEDESKTGSISGTSTMTIGDWSTLTSSRDISTTCTGVITKYDNSYYTYYCNSCGTTSRASNYGNTCGKSITSYYIECNLCSNRNGDIGDTCGAYRTGNTWSCSNCSRTGYFSGTCGNLITSATYCTGTCEEKTSAVYKCRKCSSIYSSSGTCTKTITSTCGGSFVQQTKKCGGARAYNGQYWYCTICKTKYGESGNCTALTYYYECTKCFSTFSSGGYCTASISSTCGGIISFSSSATYGCNKCSRTGSFSGTCGQKLTDAVYCTGTCKSKSYGYFCTGTMRQYSSTGTCSGTITRKLNDSYLYKCNSCFRSSTSSYVGCTCGKTITNKEDYDYCSVCGKNL